MIFLFLGGPLAIVGVVLGGWIGWRLWNRSHISDFFANEGNVLPENSEILIELLGYVAKADNHVSPEEKSVAAAYIQQIVQQSQTNRESAQKAFNRGLRQDYPIQNRLYQLRNRLSPEQCVVILEAVANVALADRRLDAAEQRVLTLIGARLAIPMVVMERLFRHMNFEREHADDYRYDRDYQSRSQGSSPLARDEVQEAYDLLGVSETATDSDIKKQWRKLNSEYHPDKLNGSGMPPGVVDLAESKLAKINSAYEVIKKVREAR